MILAMDTSTDVLTVSLHDGKEIIEEYSSKNKNKHSTRLMPAIDRIMKEAKVKPEQLTKIIVGIGPGSYTGIRIALSTAKTMAWTLNIPVVGVSSLKALCLSAIMSEGYVCSFLDARRGLVYAGLYDKEGKSVLPEMNIHIDQWIEKLAQYDEPITFISPDAAHFQSLIHERLGESANFGGPGHQLIRAGLLAEYGKDMAPTDPHLLVPNYLRMVEAEAKWLEAKRKSDNER
ncbi:tRNA (adenosine(37)-N6)-threonylcarbamoyltransferase complex dimerization subunit type 1 TsaB [Halolactibacillus alkaliphilus]|uniref:tRNA (Adenosine(37)-N6)-threonylcarbamoyltransferase complex dimerization subunit type 1 TsaB n=1 Tax=Halolactibacillus alkaliphilus TaxID=442899 RepID=A0A511X478_9BACI|nr:tRNA (adenosine(37)-N6)-threonylcarbamoyltransferase complex dimerization subunit type 1 TsaB [Halolactibacillus alkaliphilus]GEN57752.1 tRNA (adenosine(37)-N6)-threonylcarbamoyltransferase complex dimerization subunit type 1 TsaB [Halolactibacillus alkaliphilus]GGN74987.1 tRNA (adenosine(37)-N6)-threonylcarbamoyltransferase complex dimerization subunit type 1 TsaB [Halolactibacillus alkaliphilus]SFP03900.1 tRNA threonylcarbamoyladenosine biosynthesis protein TsaB [Halolactibacillus alkaliphi